MQRHISRPLAFSFLMLASLPAWGALKSLYVFGDSLSTASPNSAITSGYYGDRWSNGRVWVEVLAQQLGLTFDLAGNTNSEFGNTSDALVAEVKNYVPPLDASNVLVVIWVNNADLYEPASSSPTLDKFNSVIAQAQTNHYNAITNLYAKGIRNLIMPNVVDISTIPAFNSNPTYTNLLHQASTNYNAAFYATLNRVLTNANYQGLKIYTPDYFSLLANLIAHPASYGVTNALQGSRSIDALAALGSNTSVSNGPGTNYIFWDGQDPTAKVHSIMASVAKQMIAPVRIAKLTPFSGSNRLDLVNVPVYTNVPMNGLVLSRTNLVWGSWTTNLAFSATNLAQSVWITNAGPRLFYKLEFPYAWAWP